MRRPATGILLQRPLEQPQDHAHLLGVGRLRRRDSAGALVLRTAVDEQGGVAAVVEDQVGAAVGPGKRALGAPPVLLERLALPGEDGHAARALRRAVGADRHGGGGVILGREDVAGRPAHRRAEGDQRLDQDRGLDGHVQRAGDARAAQRLRLAELAPGRHQAGHLVLGELDLLAAERGQAEVGDLEIGAGGDSRRVHRSSRWVGCGGLRPGRLMPRRRRRQGRPGRRRRAGRRRGRCAPR